MNVLGGLRFAAVAAAGLVLAGCGQVTPPDTGGLRPTPPVAASPPAIPSSPSPAASPSPSPLPSPSPQPSPATAGHRIVISLGTQHLWAYDGDVLVLDTIVATGRPELPTVTGSFKILVKYSPYEFISPWPPGSPYWYAPAWSSYAMEFESSGFFIHDAPWRSVWGPGANITAGSHGCVNVPIQPMARLYEWARVGDQVNVWP